MRTMIDTIAASEAEELEAARVRYAQLLEPADPDPADADELRSLMAKLGKTADTLRADHGVIQQARREEAAITDGSGLDEASVAAEKAKADHYAESQRIEAERQKEAERLSLVSHQLHNRRRAAQSAHDTLAKLAHMRPDLLKDRAKLARP